MPLRILPLLAFLPLAAIELRAQGGVVLQLTDYAAVPQSGVLVNPTDNAVYVARVNFLREEPGGGLNRFFVCDLNGKLYLLDQTTKQFATYLDFQRNSAKAPTTATANAREPLCSTSKPAAPTSDSRSITPGSSTCSARATA